MGQTWGVLCHRGRLGQRRAGDISGRFEIAPVKAGCINVTVTKIWNASQVGTYDVVVDPGAVPAASAGAWVADNTYNANYDFIDRAADIGAWVVEDPAVPGPYAVQSTSYAPAPPGNPNDPLWTDIAAYYNVAVPAPLHGEVRYPTGTSTLPPGARGARQRDPDRAER